MPVIFNTDLKEYSIKLNWLVWLRWGAIIGQLIVFLIAQFVLKMGLDAKAFAVLSLLGIVLNLLPTLLNRYLHDRSIIKLIIISDLILLTLMLYYYGGHTNPFSTVYLIHVVLTALSLGQIWSWVVFVLSALAYAVLSFYYIPVASLDLHQHSQQTFSLHLNGMLLAFTLIGALLTYFLSRLTSELSKQSEQILRLTKQSADQHKLIALTNLAAGAAHELRTPLATILIANHEMHRSVQIRNASDPILQDIKLISAELERCHAILNSMAINCGELSGESAKVIELNTLAETLVSYWSNRSKGLEFILTNNCTNLSITTFEQALLNSLNALIKNGYEANSPKLELKIEKEGDNIVFHVVDFGEGISSDVIDRIGEPFFSLKPPGHGMGLGLFLVKLYAARVNGSFTFCSKLRQGSSAKLTIPIYGTFNSR